MKALVGRGGEGKGRVGEDGGDEIAGMKALVGREGEGIQGKGRVGWERTVEMRLQA